MIEYNRKNSETYQFEHLAYQHIVIIIMISKMKRVLLIKIISWILMYFVNDKKNQKKKCKRLKVK